MSIEQTIHALTQAWLKSANVPTETTENCNQKLGSEINVAETHLKITPKPIGLLKMSEESDADSLSNHWSRVYSPDNSGTKMEGSSSGGEEVSTTSGSDEKSQKQEVRW